MSHPARRCHRGHGRTDVCALYALTGRLWVPIGVHLAWNLAQGYLFGAIVSGNNLGGSLLLSTARPEAPPWLTGGTFGPEASVLALILVSTVTVGALGLPRKPRRFATRPKPPKQQTPSAAPAGQGERGSSPPREASLGIGRVRHLRSASGGIAAKSDIGARIRTADRGFSPVSVIRDQWMTGFLHSARGHDVGERAP